MGKYLCIIGWVCVVGISTAYADETSKKLTACMFENTSEDQKLLMQRWAFSVISSNPDVQQFFAYTHNPVLQEKLDKQLADTVSDIVLGACKQQLVKTLFTEGTKAVEDSAKTWGKSAIKGIADSPKVQHNATAFIKHLTVF